MFTTHVQQDPRLRTQFLPTEVPEELKEIRFPLKARPGNNLSALDLADPVWAKHLIQHVTGASTVRVHTPGSREGLNFLSLADLSVWLDETGAITSMRWN